MFLLIPLLFIIASLVGILVVVYRKKTYIDKLFVLNVAGNESGPSVLAGQNFKWSTYGEEFFPEIKVMLDKFKFHEYKATWLMEVEKLLRRTRLMSLRVDRVSDTLIKKIRRSNLNHQMKKETITEETIDLEDTLSTADKKELSPNFLKNEEQRLIMEIAKNPKDPILYEALGDLYVDMNNLSDAKESYKAAIELNSQKESLNEKLSSVLEKMASQN